jgi:hypothetical protein
MYVLIRLKVDVSIIKESSVILSNEDVDAE